MKNLISLLTLFLFINYSFSQTGKIDVNNINATVNASNVMFQTLAPDTNTYFEAIKSSGMSTIFASSFWMAGVRDSDTALCGSFQSYKSNSIDNTFSTGPLSVVSGSGTGGKRDFGAATISAAEKAIWNKVFCVNKWEIEIFVRWWKCFSDPICDVSLSFPGYSIPLNILNWPVYGDVSKGQEFYMAPFYDNDGDGIYTPLNGDYPCIKGDQYCWYIINDRGFDSTRIEMGLEIHTEIYSFNKDSLNPLSNTIFVGRDIINRSTETYNNFIVSQQTDFDIGCAQDDYSGTMPNLNSYYAYNGDPIDDNCTNSAFPYGINPPAQGVTFLNETLSAGIYYNNSAGPPGPLSDLEKAYNSMNGKISDGSPIYYGHPSSTPPVPTNITKFMFPYLPPTGKLPWTEVTAGNPIGDRRMLGSVGPITFTPGDVYEVDLAYVFSRSDSGHLKSVDKLYRDIQTVQAFYNDSIPKNCMAFVLSEKELMLSPNDVSVYPNPANQSITIQNKTEEELSAKILSIDGKLIVPQFEINSNNKIDISKLNNGLYLIRVTNSKNQVIVKKLIKN
jgi:hypothetical protein